MSRKCHFGILGIGTTTPGAKFQVHTAADDYFQIGTNNPRAYLKVPTGINGLRIDADTSPLELRNLSDTNITLAVNGSSMNTTWTPTNATAISTTQNSPQLLFTSKYWNGTSSATNFQGQIYALATSAAANGGGLSLGTTNTPNSIFIQSDGNVGICIR